MQTLTAELSSAVTVDDVHAAVGTTGRALLGADAVSIALLEPGSDRIEVWSSGAAGESDPAAQSLAAAAEPTGRAVVTDGQARFLARLDDDADGAGALALLPLAAPRRRPRGYLALHYARRPRLPGKRAGTPARRLRPDRERTQPRQHPGSRPAHRRGAPAGPPAGQPAGSRGGASGRLLPAGKRGHDRRGRLVRRRRAQRRDDCRLGRRRRGARDPGGRADGASTPFLPCLRARAPQPGRDPRPPDPSHRARRDGDRALLRHRPGGGAPAVLQRRAPAGDPLLHRSP